MSVLNQSGDEKVECPLCMEPLEVDDLTFFPCACGYQICRFCWHRIRTDENGLCPHCRKAYSENPADFIPLTQEQVAKLKAEKRQRDQQRKAKLSESRKHLASVRVVQRNLVFVVGLPVRLADADVLKKHEYFGKFGKIHKVVINQSTTYAGSQGPSASAYVTYVKSDDALKAIQSVNNIAIDGRQIKSSLGTTKYCSHFMKNQPCPKADCMYLHDFGDPEASFTKEQMHAGKHQEYEKKLHDALLQRTNQPPSNGVAMTTTPITTTSATPTTTVSPSTNGGGGGDAKKHSGAGNKENCNHKENWPQLKNDVAPSIKKNDSKKGNRGDKKATSAIKQEQQQRRSNDVDDIVHKLDGKHGNSEDNDNSSFFSSAHNFHKLMADRNRHHLDENEPEDDDEVDEDEEDDVEDEECDEDDEDEIEDEEDENTQTPELADSLPTINTSEDWVAAFGLRHTKNRSNVDEKPSSVSSQSFQVPFPSFNSDVTDTKDLLDALVTTATANKPPTYPEVSCYTDLDSHVSKLFMNLQQLHSPPPPVQQMTVQQQQQKNGFNGLSNGYNAERLLLLQQKKIEEQLMNLSMNAKQQQHSYLQQQQQQQQHLNNGHFLNGDNTITNSIIQNNGYGGHNFGYNFQQQLYLKQQQQQQKKQQQQQQQHDADLDFDPFQETQKALAEIIAKEQNHAHTNSTSSRSNMNGHKNSGGGGGHVPPPPPGFMQPTMQQAQPPASTTPHMNSFGSKILPFLNMSNHQQQQQNGWSNNGYNNGQMSQHYNKNGYMSDLNGYNDWKDFDSAILSTSHRHYPLNLGQMRAAQPQQQQMNGLLRADEFALLSSNFQQHQQQQQYQNYSNFSATMNNHMLNQQPQQQPPQPNYSNWFVGNSTSNSSELNGASSNSTTAAVPISSPPGFRPTAQTSKQQQEC